MGLTLSSGEDMLSVGCEEISAAWAGLFLDPDDLMVEYWLLCSLLDLN
jgi:hypothetical protein